MFGVLELVSLDLFLVMLAGGALVGAVTALLGGPFPLQIVLALISGGRRCSASSARASYAACTAVPTSRPAPTP